MNALDVFAAARPDVEVDEQVLADIAADVFDGRPRRPSSAGRWRLLAVAAAVVALVAGLALVVGRPGGSAPAESVPPAIPDDREPLAMLPEDVAPWRIIGSMSMAVDSPVETWSAVIARPTGDGYDSPVLVHRGPSDVTLFQVDVPDSDATSEPVALRDDRVAELVDDRAGSRQVVQFELGDGTAVAVSTDYREPLSGERARILQIAANIEFSADGDARFTSLPDGFEIVAPWAHETVPTVRWAFVDTADDAGPAFAINVVRDADPDSPVRWMGDEIAPLDVRGTTGWLSTQRYPGRDEVQSLSVVWQERPGQWVRVEVQHPAALDELLAFVESLREVSATEWDAIVALPGDTGTPATTAPLLPDLVAPGTQEPPATTAPRTAPSGSVLMASNVAGLGAVEGRPLGLQGAELLDPVEIPTNGGPLIETSRVFARSGAEGLGAWVAGQLGIEAVEPFDLAAGVVAGVDLSFAEVVVVLGLDRASKGGRAVVPWIVGDSLLDMPAALLEARGYLSVELDWERLREYLVGSEVDFGVVVLQAGTDAPVSPEQLSGALAALAEVPNVIIVNVDADVPWRAEVNAQLAAVDHPEDNLILMDWDALAEQCPGECFVSDGIHLSDAGAEYFADRLGDITGY